MRYKLIIKDTDGVQKLLEVEEGGRYFDKSKVLWDEREKGKLTTDQINKIGGWKWTTSGNFSYAQTRYDSNETLKDSEENKNCLKECKQKAKRLITESNWSLISDSPLTLSKKDEYVTYRDSLRSILNETDYKNITWPTEPE